MRSIKPEFFADQDLAEDLPDRDARLLYIGLWGLADEHGRLRGDARAIKGQLFAFDDDLTAEAVDALINMIASSGRAIRYRVGKAVYLFLPKLAEHQRLEPDKVPSRLPSHLDEQAEQTKIGSSEKFPDESARDANESELARARLFEHVAGGMEQEAGSREQTPASPPASARPPIVRFDELWAVYPLQDGETEARKAWCDAIKRDSPDVIIAGAIRYRDWPQRSAQHTKRLANWLRNDCWRDTLAAAVPPPRSARAAPGLEEHNGLMLGPSNVANLERHQRMKALQAQRDAAASQTPAIEGRAQ